MPRGALSPRDGYTLSIHQFVGSAATGSIACDSCAWSEPFAVPVEPMEAVGVAVGDAVRRYTTHPHRGAAALIGSDIAEVSK